MRPSGLLLLLLGCVAFAAEASVTKGPQKMPAGESHGCACDSIPQAVRWQLLWEGAACSSAVSASVRSGDSHAPLHYSMQVVCSSSSSSWHPVLWQPDIARLQSQVAAALGGPCT